MDLLFIILLFSFLSSLVFGLCSWVAAIDKDRQRELDTNTCRICRYDIHARDDSRSICPECGSDQDDTSQPPIDKVAKRLRALAFILLFIATVTAMPVGIPVALLIYEAFT